MKREDISDAFIIIYLVLFFWGIHSCNQRLENRIVSIEKACIPKCGKHPVITQDKEGNCLCNNTVTIEK